ncbi:glycosyltransferase family 2 protein [Thermus sp.]|uniref:glycosyltransferase family 2 protein n=1 Tax=Thermus sp. TaxID=275 RepID=UPI00391B2668
MPTYNEEKTIAHSVRSFLSLHYPEFEVIVVADGPKDRTLEVLKEAFRLVEVEWVYRRALATKPVRAVYRSLVYPNLIVVDKENGGKADALNAGLNLARYPLFCAVDADSLLDAQALLRASRLFLEDDRVLAVGGTLRPLNGAVVREGIVETLHLPRGYLEKVQIVEYARAFFMGRAGWSAMGALLIISGAFGLFRREEALRVGGYRTDTVGEDMELVVRLHRRAREEGREYRIVYTPDPICYTEVPADWATLRKQRNRWHRGLWEVLWNHRTMLFNPRYGRLGLVAMPYFFLFEALAPVVEVLGYVLFPVFYSLASSTRSLPSSSFSWPWPKGWFFPSWRWAWRPCSSSVIPGSGTAWRSFFWRSSRAWATARSWPGSGFSPPSRCGGSGGSGGRCAGRGWSPRRGRAVLSRRPRERRMLGRGYP